MFAPEIPQMNSRWSNLKILTKPLNEKKKRKEDIDLILHVFVHN